MFQVEFPNVGPVIVSLIVLPAISVPVTVKTVDDKSPPSDNILIVPFKDECDVGVPNETPEEHFFRKRESLSVDAPLSHCPNSIFIEPEPVEDVGKEYPEISKVWDVANDVILISLVNCLAIEGLEIDNVAEVLVDEVVNLVLFLNPKTLVFNLSKSETIVPISEIAVFWTSIFIYWSLSGAVSAWTMLSTICVMFKPDLLNLKHLDNQRS